MKKCSKCKQQLPDTAFAKRRYKSGKVGLQPYCKKCNNSERVKYYKNNKQHHIDYNEKRLRAVQDKVMQHLLENPCVECGETDILVLQFDHINPKDKEFSISDALRGRRYTWKRVEKEIAKCRVLCANCHSRHTAHQINSYRLRYINGPVV